MKPKKLKPYNVRLRIAKNKLWKKISELVRRKSAVNDYVTCYTCSTLCHWKGIHAGHYIAQGSCSELEYDLNNIRPQCYGCNVFKSGNTVVFRYNLVKEIGEEKVKELEEKRMRLAGKKWNLTEIEEMTEKIDAELSRL